MSMFQIPCSCIEEHACCPICITRPPQQRFSSFSYKTCQTLCTILVTKMTKSENTTTKRHKENLKIKICRSLCSMVNKWQPVRYSELNWNAEQNIYMPLKPFIFLNLFDTHLELTCVITPKNYCHNRIKCCIVCSSHNIHGRFLQGHYE